MKSTWDTLIQPVAVELTPAGEQEAERLKTGLLSCGCYAGACYCGLYPTDAQWSAMQAEGEADLPEREPLTLAEETEAEDLRNFFGRRQDA
jgi:hypothetical protein